MNAVHAERDIQYEERIYIKTSSAVTTGRRSLEDDHIYKLALADLFAALSYVVFTSLQIKITLPRGDATSTRLGNVVYVLGALILEGFYGGLGGALGMTIGDLFDPVYAVYALKTFPLKPCIGLITGLVTHRIGRTDESSDKGHVFHFVVAAPVCDLLLSVILDPLVGYYYKLTISDKPVAELVPTWNTASTSINAVMSAAVVMVIYMPLRDTLTRTGLSGRLR